MPHKRPPGKPAVPRHPTAPIPSQAEIASRAAAIRAANEAAGRKTRAGHVRPGKAADTMEERYEPRVHRARFGRDEREER